MQDASQRWPTTSARGGSGSAARPGPRAPVIRNAASRQPPSGSRALPPQRRGSRAARAALIARRLRGTEAHREDGPEHDQDLTEDVAGVPLPDDALDPSASLTASIRPSSTANSARSSPSCAAYSPASRVMSAAARDGCSASAAPSSARRDSPDFFPRHTMFGRRYRTRSVREERDAAAFMLLERHEITAGALPHDRHARHERSCLSPPGL